MLEFIGNGNVWTAINWADWVIQSDKPRI